jgi:hypothetical protein
MGISTEVAGAMATILTHLPLPGPTGAPANLAPVDAAAANAFASALEAAGNAPTSLAEPVNNNPSKLTEGLKTDDVDADPVLADALAIPVALPLEGMMLAYATGGGLVSEFAISSVQPAQGTNPEDVQLTERAEDYSADAAFHQGAPAHRGAAGEPAFGHVLPSPIGDAERPVPAPLALLAADIAKSGSGPGAAPQPLDRLTSPLPAQSATAPLPTAGPATSSAPFGGTASPDLQTTVPTAEPAVPSPWAEMPDSDARKQAGQGPVTGTLPPASVASAGPQQLAQIAGLGGVLQPVQRPLHGVVSVGAAGAAQSGFQLRIDDLAGAEPANTEAAQTLPLPSVPLRQAGADAIGTGTPQTSVAAILAEPAFADGLHLQTFGPEVPGQGAAGLSALPMSQPTAAPAPQSAPVPLAVLPQAVAMAALADPSQAVSLRLDPLELGNVAFTMESSPAGLIVTIIAERPETADLLRRHADQFLADLRQSGFQGASVQFGQSGLSGQSGQSGQDQSQPHPSPLTHAAPQQPATAPFAPAMRPSQGNGSGGLNLRL